ncbi:hypothetical protein AVEN_120918-1 [Araneus ventricosus]|uniref:Peptidase aspartic putative domain-containing protein n=1 Tax=Araneus ventricosus TaxID=182803 RepID=A0A4Y2NR67_ARAVE|nr:hypothetical protein AVEN_120918-1 [Araneus ventricosus]
MFLSAKSCKKEDLILVAQEIGENVPPTAKICDLKGIILNSDEYKSDPDFVKGILENAVTDRKLQEEFELEKIKLNKEQEFELEKIKLKQQQELELEKLKINSELELTRMQTQNQNQGMIYQQIPETSNAKKKFTLPKLQFRQFGDDLKDWLPFWSQFEHVDKDDDIAPENKFQYLVQTTVVGSRAREVVESFLPTGENYAKAVDSLKARFGREDLLVEVYVRELLKLIISVHSNQKLAPTFLYDKLESYLRALETLGVTTDKCASILYPMVESCFDEEFLKAWNRSPTSSSANDAKERLENLMLFIKGEVEGEERISLAMSGFGLTKGEDIKMPRKKKYNLETQRGKIPTASMLLASTRTTEVKKPKCIFCDGKHVSSDCFNAQKLTLEEKQKIAFKNTNQKKEEEENPSGNDVNLSNVNPNPKVFLQTFKAKLLSSDKEKTVRVLCDTGSQKSYILKNIAEEMKYPVGRQETIKHSLFDCVSTKECKHNCYRIKLKQLNGNFTCNFEVLDQVNVKMYYLLYVKMNLEPIQVLIGADIMGKLLTGKRKLLSSGLVAVETHLGWTLMGKVPQVSTERVNLAMTVTSLFVKEAEIADLWRLDVLGIKDPMEKKSKQERDLKTKEHFKETVISNQDNRYEVCLPSADDSFPLPDNFKLAKKRLEEWLDEGIIEEVPPNEVALYGNYLPHRPVIKEISSTNPIRPVFDASAKLQSHPSLNQCLQCGPNLIELIPDILARFRVKKFGDTADIRKAFLQMSVSKGDRDYLRFLWWKNLEEKKLKVFRHTRVVFEVKSSPFLLASVIEHHIEASKGFDSEFKKILKQSFYVDNVVASLDSYEDLNNFISKSTQLMLQGGFELGDWESTECETEHGWETPVLGIKWNRQLDSLRVNMSWMNKLSLEKITKRIMLSAAHKVFDPIGYTAPVMLCPKLMLQKAWKMPIGWDTEITGNHRKEFLQWFQDLKILEEIHISRWINVTAENLKHCTIHTFVAQAKKLMLLWYF